MRKIFTCNSIKIIIIRKIDKAEIKEKMYFANDHELIEIETFIAK